MTLYNRSKGVPNEEKARDFLHRRCHLSHSAGRRIQDRGYYHLHFASRMLLTDLPEKALRSWLLILVHFSSRPLASSRVVSFFKTFDKM